MSDQSWEAHALNPDGSEGQNLGQAIAPFWAFHPQADISSIPGALWIWFPTDPLSPAEMQGAYFSKEFNIPGVPVEGHVAVAVDDLAKVFINGVLVGTSGSTTDLGLALEAQRDLRTFDLMPFLRHGANTLTIMAQNGPGWFLSGGCYPPCNYYSNPAGVVFGGTLSYSTPTGTQGSTWGSLKVKYR